MVENLPKKRYTIKSYRKRCKEYEENIRRYQDKYIRTFLSILRGRKIYDLPDEKSVKKALVSEDDTMNYSYFEGKRADAIEIIELAKTLPFLVIIGFDLG